MRVFITGGTGMIGRRLIRLLVERKDEVVVLSRRPDAWQQVGNDGTIVSGDPGQAGDWQDKAAECDAIINLVGAGLFEKRWTTEYKQIIRDSRVKSTEHVADVLRQSPKRADGSPKVLVQGSAIGYYGPHGEADITEDTPAGSDYIAKLCVEWENAAKPAADAGVRVAIIRTGIVQDTIGGSLPQLLTPFKLGAGGPVGMGLNPAKWGSQFWSWIHYADELGILLLALDHPEARGPINATSPNPVTSKQYAKALGHALGRPAFAPLPALALRLMLGEVASIIMDSQRILPKKALALGYKFQFPEIGPALINLCKSGSA